MFVYGDHDETVDGGAEVRRLNARRSALAAFPAGLARHAALVNLHIEAGRLAQGLADRTFDPATGDDPTPVDHAWMIWLTHSAHAVVRSWDGGFAAEPPPLPDAPSGAVTLRTPEGYAYYGLYPESYVAAARRLEVQGANARVIGLRSIGASLAPIVAAVLGAPPPITLRPTGHPFDRQVRLSAPALARLLDGETFVVVDEGPGLSGSSFAAVARLLTAHGVPPGRIVFMPSHDGEPGAAASAETRAVWRSVRRVPAVRIGDERIAAWVADVVADRIERVEDLSGGRWRGLRLHPHDWPAIDPRTDRRKLRMHATSGAFVARFVGLGAMGERKLGRALRLHAAGAVPPVVGAAHGFLVQRWIDAPAAPRPETEAVGRYLRLRRDLPAIVPDGASPEALRAMALANVEARVGAAARCALERRLPMAEVERQWRPAAVDGACQPWKWLRSGDRLLKADALDHDADHDLLGPLDPAWDLAGAALELRYPKAAHRRLLAAAVPPGQSPPTAGLLRFCALCHLAFHLGAAGMAQAAFAPGSDEWLRHEHALRRRERDLRRLLQL